MQVTRVFVLALLFASSGAFDISVAITQATVTSIQPAAVSDTMTFSASITMLISYNVDECIAAGHCDKNQDKKNPNAGKPKKHPSQTYHLPFLDFHNSQSGTESVKIQHESQEGKVNVMTLYIEAKFYPTFSKKDYPFETMDLRMTFMWVDAKGGKITVPKCLQPTKLEDLPGNWMRCPGCKTSDTFYTHSVLSNRAAVFAKGDSCKAPEQTQAVTFAIMARYSRVSYWVGQFLPTQLVVFTSLIPALYAIRGDKEGHRDAIAGTMGAFFLIFLKITTLDGVLDWNDFFIIISLGALLGMLVIHSIAFIRWVHAGHEIDAHIHADNAKQAETRFARRSLSNVLKEEASEVDEEHNDKEEGVSVGMSGVEGIVPSDMDPMVTTEGEVAPIQDHPVMSTETNYIGTNDRGWYETDEGYTKRKAEEFRLKTRGTFRTHVWILGGLYYLTVIIVIIYGTVISYCPQDIPSDAQIKYAYWGESPTTSVGIRTAQK